MAHTVVMTDPSGPAPDGERPDPPRPGAGGDDLDARFAEIVAGWDGTAETSGSALRGEWSVDLPVTDALPASEPDLPRPATGRGPTFDGDVGTDPAGASWSVHPRPPAPGWRGHLPPEEDEHFVPPDPPALPPAHDATYWLALAGLTIGPLVVVWAAAFSGNPDPGWWVLLGIAATVVGFGLLVLRGSGERDPDDDGAQV